jgi:hypothetical protein
VLHAKYWPHPAKFFDPDQNYEIPTICMDYPQHGRDDDLPLVAECSWRLAHFPVHPTWDQYPDICFLQVAVPLLFTGKKVQKFPRAENPKRKLIAIPEKAAQTNR